MGIEALKLALINVLKQNTFDEVHLRDRSKIKIFDGDVTGAAISRSNSEPDQLRHESMHFMVSFGSSHMVCVVGLLSGLGYLIRKQIES